MSEKRRTCLRRDTVKFRRGDRMNRSSQSAHYTPRWFLYRRTRIFSPYKFTCTTTRHSSARPDSGRLSLAWHGMAWPGVLVVVPRRLGPKIPGTSSTINPAVYRRGGTPGRELVAAARSFPWRSFRLPEYNLHTSGVTPRWHTAWCTRVMPCAYARYTPLINRRYDH